MYSFAREADTPTHSPTQKQRELANVADEVTLVAPAKLVTGRNPLEGVLTDNSLARAISLWKYRRKDRVGKVGHQSPNQM